MRNKSGSGASRPGVDAPQPSRMRLPAELLEQTREPIVVWALDGTISHWNRGAEQTYGYSAEHASGRDIHELLATDAGGQDFLTALRARGHWAGELAHTARDGQKILVESHMALVTAADGSRLVIETMQPITERVLREAALRKRAEDLTAADRSKNEFLAVLAHELRNPLAALRSASEVLAQPEVSAGAVSEARAVIEHQTGQMSSMVDDLLDVSRISHGAIELALQPVDLAKVIRNAVAATDHQRKTGGQKLTVTLPPDPVRVMADPMRLEQIIQNLLSNAAKFTSSGGNIEISLAVADASDDPPKMAVIRVSDDGEGIPAHLLPHVFEMFTRAEGQRAPGRSGLGIGLSLAQRLAELHGGTIEAHSAGARRGSELVVHLPLTGRPLGSSRPPQPQQTAPQRVLIIDDNLDALRMMQILLESDGHTVRLAHDGKAALQTALEFLPDVILLDIGLPGIDGYGVAAGLRSEPSLRQSRLVAVTGYGRPEDVRRSRDAGFDDHLTKPVDPSKLRQAIGSGKGRRQPRGR